MDGLGQVSNIPPCGDLERLAAAAATMGYSSDMLPIPAHQLSNHSTIGAGAGSLNSMPVNALPQTLVSPYPDAYDLSTHQHYAALRLANQYQPRTMYDQVRPNNSMSQQHQLPSPSNRQEPNYPQSYIPAMTRHTVPTIAPASNAIHFLNARGINAIPDTSTHHAVPPILNFAQTQAPTPTVTATLNVGGVLSSQSSAAIVAPSTSPVSLATAVVVERSVVADTNPIPIPDIPPSVVAPVAPLGTVSPRKKSKRKAKAAPKARKSAKKAKPKPPTVPKEPKICAALAEEKDDDPSIPAPVIIEGRRYFVCTVCNNKYPRRYLFKRHQNTHTSEKRGALSLEKKVEIIKRIKAGEKQVDLATEYNIGRSTLSFMMRNAGKLETCLEKRKYHPETKRLRGAHREDVEEALWEWYKQAQVNDVTVSGPILCKKAKDFASKLGYSEFKPTHGWLDRFKHRKNFFLGRGKSQSDKEKGRKKKKDTDENGDDVKEESFIDQILPDILVDYDNNDVFHASEIGLMFRVLINESNEFKQNRCAGGKHAKKRITVLMCTNMTGSEKFPLLVIGKYSKPKCFRNVKSLPVQYIAQEKAWMTHDNFGTWLSDLDAWFVQQNRKILLVVPSLPIHAKSIQLNAVRVVISPPAFIGPCKLGIIQCLKRNYRRAVLEAHLAHLESFASLGRKRTKRPAFRMSLLCCLHKLATSWHAITDITITNSFHRSGLGKYGLWGTNLVPETSLGTENLDLIIKLKQLKVSILPGFTFDDFITFDDEVQVCHLMDDEDILFAVMRNDEDNSSDDEDDFDEASKVDDGDDYHGPPYEEVETYLSTVRNHIALCPNGVGAAQEMFRVLTHLEFLLEKSRKENEEQKQKIVEEQQKITEQLQKVTEELEQEQQKKEKELKGEEAEDDEEENSD